VTKSNLAENAVLDHMTGKATWGAITAYVGLMTAVADAEAGTITEVTGTGYARVATIAANWNSAANGSTSNAQAITFAQAGGSWSSGNPITNFGLFNASSGAGSTTLLRSAALGASKVIGTGDTASFAAGALVMTED
jgi:hypothetical protein